MQYLYLIKIPNDIRESLARMFLLVFTSRLNY